MYLYIYQFILNILSLIKDLLHISMECLGSFNTSGFTSQIQSGHLPQQSHITYQGVFNQIKFDIGPKTELRSDLHFGYARYQFQQSINDNSINDYLALFLKGSADGADRDARVLNAMICLDISGSMGEGLKQHKSGGRSRLSLSVQAIIMFISKLRANDSVGIITFNHEAQIILEPTLKSKLPQNLFQNLSRIKQNGGTTIKSGFQMSKLLLSGYIQSHPSTQPSENRIVMLTDVGDNSIQNQREFIENVSKVDGINLTIIGISDQFRSEVCQTLKDVKGFNYFCAVDNDDIKKYVFEMFDFVYFPSSFDLSIKMTSEDVKSFEVFGAPDSKNVNKYNENFDIETNEFVITKVKSSFPSELEISGGKTYTFGGLILLKLKRKSMNASFKGEIVLEYSDPNGKNHRQAYKLDYGFPSFQQYFSQQSLKEAIQAYIFTSQLKQILIQADKIHNLSQVYDRFWPLLTNLQQRIPQSKKQQVRKIKEIILKSKNQNAQKKSAKNIIE